MHTNIKARNFTIPAGWALIASRPYSTNPGDHYLSVVLCHDDEKGEWVTWLYNSQTGGCVSGHYFRDHDAALSDYVKR